MLKINLIVFFICVQIFVINCYTINHLQRNAWSDIDVESKDEFLAKLQRMENFFHDNNQAFDQTDVPSHGLQKRGRQCLWKVCSWALDKRSIP